jgi:trimethylamine:corrinoid methyltransferase-like protein
MPSDWVIWVEVVEDETLAVSAIAEGRGSFFPIRTPSTSAINPVAARIFKSQRIRAVSSGWETTLLEKAVEKLQTIVETHRPPVVEKEIKKRIQDRIQRFNP